MAQALHPSRKEVVEVEDVLDVASRGAVPVCVRPFIERGPSRKGLSATHIEGGGLTEKTAIGGASACKQKSVGAQTRNIGEDTPKKPRSVSI